MRNTPNGVEWVVPVEGEQWVVPGPTGSHFKQPYTLHPTPYTLHPAPYTLHLTLYTLLPTPHSLDHHLVRTRVRL